jgi:hypothetical protein
MYGIVGMKGLELDGTLKTRQYQNKRSGFQNQCAKKGNNKEMLKQRKTRDIQLLKKSEFSSTL